MSKTVTTVVELRTVLASQKSKRIGMVPTMGALHDGHLALVEGAKTYADLILVSIFVNPSQFGPAEDFNAYPRTLEDDLAKLNNFADLVFVPPPHEIYPSGYATTIHVGGPAIGLESDFRPHFFSGVATVVTKLLIAASPDVAVFGEKDYQQLLVVRQLVRDLGLGVEIVGVPTVREDDGLARSSRNVYLDPAQRKIAGRLNVVLKQAAALAHAKDIATAEAWAAQALRTEGFDAVDYVSIREAQTLAPMTALDRPARILAAAKVGRTRLIDNMPV